jgi:hypothetical protein
MSIQIAKNFFEFRLLLFVVLEFLGMECGEEFVPDDVEFALHVVGLSGDGDDGVFFGDDDAELAVFAIAAKGVVAAAPELEAVALVPIFGRVAAVGDLFGGGLLDPRSRNQLFAVPFAFLQIEQAEFGDVFSANFQTKAAGTDSLRTGTPIRIFDAEWFEEARLEIIENGLAGDLGDDRGEHVTAGGVVLEMGSRFVRNGMSEEGLDPRCVGVEFHFDFVTAGHGEQIAHAHHFEFVGRIRGSVVGKEFQDGIVDAQFAIGDGEAHRRRSEAFAERMHDVRFVRGFGFPPTFCDYVSMADEHKAVHGIDLLVGGFDVGADVSRGDALFLGSAAREGKSGGGAGEGHGEEESVAD